MIAAYGEMASAPAPFTAVRVPTLVVLGAESYVPYDHLRDAHREALALYELYARVLPQA